MSVTVVTAGSKELMTYLETVPELAKRAMRLAINGTAKGKGMTAIKRQMLDEVAFPSGYLNADRLRVTRLASDNNLEATITGRKRATSLARFVTGNPVVGSDKGGGVSVRVQRGRTTYLKQAFLVRLKRGASLSEDNYNLGLAVRLKPGESLTNKRTQHQAWLVPNKVALLYGPSVDQVFSGVIEELRPVIGQEVASEFHRQFARLSK
ncbi:hypothetical protein [Cronobacter phage JC01]|uniref:Uncharacterized protein n=1 Tax=Cronobacter phage JC01 TaxID=2729575 RepID=A0A6M3YKJ8_9CAUD|nr:hypothetical protein JT331_gp19 [Cronobacter phage JC01]QJI52238.1 hypothetical protein [Cronobacter phage JC01]